MFRRVLNVLLFLAFLATLALHGMISGDPSRRNIELIPEMVRTPAYNSYAPNPNFTDGRTFQSPSPGTIARGQMPLHYGLMPDEALRAGSELYNPIFLGPAHLIAPTGSLLQTIVATGVVEYADTRARERGAFVFTNYCQVCHGPEGKGNGPLTQRGYPFPPSLVMGLTVQRKDGELFHVISYGSVQRKSGQIVPGNMPGHAGQLSPEDRWNAILHIRVLQQKPAGENKQ